MQNNKESFIKILTEICNGDDIDIQFIEKQCNNIEEVFIPSVMLDDLINKLDCDARCKEFWDLIISHIHVDSFTDDQINYFYKNEIAVISFCHKELSDKWLKRYIKFDDAPLYTLSIRYYKDNSCSCEQFSLFAQEYILKSKEVYSFLLEYMEISQKWNILIYLGMQYPCEDIQKVANTFSEIFYLSYTANEEDIINAYLSNKKNGKILLAIAKNICTPIYILEELSCISNVYQSTRIKRTGAETMKIKKAINKIVDRRTL